MKRTNWIGGLLATSSLLLASCLNPFAPVEGTVGARVWSDQTTAGGLLHNFSLAYDYRDSLRYADCLDDEFAFYYYDVQAAHFDSWFRDTDLRATGGLFRAYDRIDLEWNSVPDEVNNFNYPDSSLRFVVRFNLTLGDEVPLMGYANFAVRIGNDGRFRVTEWHDAF